MSPFVLALLAFQVAVFVVWAYLAFRWLFALRADAVAESGTAFPGPGPTLRAFRGGLVDGRYAKERIRLGLLTVVLLASSVVHALL